MKKQYRLFFILIAVSGLSITCKADTVDNYQIYIGNTLKLTEASFRPAVSQIRFLTLDSTNSSDTIHINFNHCTAGASSRQIKLTDTAGNTIKVWDFGDKELQPDMHIAIAEILTDATIFRNGTYYLYYHDREYSYWQLLTPVVIRETAIKKEVANNSLGRSGYSYQFYGTGILFAALLFYQLRRWRKSTRQ